MSYIPNFNRSATINTSGTWTCPAGVFWALLTIWAGGGGGYTQSDGSSYISSGSGGGGEWRQMLIPVTPGVTYNFVIGSGGTGYANFSNVSGSATAGGNSYCYTAAAQTTLGAAISTTTNGFQTLAAVTGLVNGSVIQVDNEIMLVLQLGTAGTSNTYLLRGWLGTTAATHSNAATVNLINVIALVRGGSQGVQGAGGNGGGYDGSSGGGANTSSGAGAGKTAQNGRGGIGGGGGAQSSSGGFVASPGGTTETAQGFSPGAFSIGSAFSNSGISGGASWGPGNPGGVWSAAATMVGTPNTGGGGGSGGSGSSGGAALAWQGA